MKRYSRLKRVEERKAKRSAMFYIVLTVVLIVFLIIFGIPIFSKLASFANEVSNGNNPVTTVDTTPPAPPIVDEPPEFTNDTNIKITGSAEPEATVVVDSSGVQKEVVVSSGGSFEVSVSLKDGENDFVLWVKDKAGNKSEQTKTYSVTYDKDAPDLEIIAPSDGASFYGEAQKQVLVEGQTESEARVSVNDRFAVVNSEGKFSISVGLNDGTNEIKVVAEDRAGNKTEKSVSVTFSS